MPTIILFSLMHNLTHIEITPNSQPEIFLALYSIYMIQIYSQLCILNYVYFSTIYTKSYGVPLHMDLVRDKLAAKSKANYNYILINKLIRIIQLVHLYMRIQFRYLQIKVPLYLLINSVSTDKKLLTVCE